MTQLRFNLGHLFGFPLWADLRWLLATAVLLATFGGWVYPGQHAGLEGPQHWAMALATVLGFWLSIIVHKLGHAWTARHYGETGREIGLVVGGDLFEATLTNADPEAELMTALAGPYASFLAALAASIAWLATVTAQDAAAAAAVFGYVAALNFLLAFVNLLPAFPLDGARILRAFLWWFQGSSQWAAGATAAISSGLSLALTVVGVAIQLLGFLPLGIAIFVLGLGLNSVGHLALRQTLASRSLVGQPVARFMRAEPLAVQRSISVEQLVEEFFQRHPSPAFAVIDGEKVFGLVGAGHVRRLPREEWDRQTVGSIAERASRDNTVAPDSDAFEALSLMHRSGLPVLLVAEGDRLVGTLSGQELARTG